MIGKIYSGLREVLLPARCFFCSGEVVGYPEDFDCIPRYVLERVCHDCALSLLPLREPRCTICSLPFEGSGPSHPCPSCLKKVPPFGELHVWGPYSGQLKRGVQMMKYGDSVSVRGLLVELFVAACLERWGDSPDFTEIVPVPAHPRTLFGRGFDLPALLAFRISRQWRIPLRYDLIGKRGHAVKMAGLGLSRRREEIRNLYYGKGRAGKKVLIVDDVATSLATLRSCARIALRAGADGVSCAALARTPVAPSKRI